MVSPIIPFRLLLSNSAATKRSEGSEGPVSSRLRHLPGRYLSTSQLPVSTPPSPLNARLWKHDTIVSSCVQLISDSCIYRRSTSGPQKRLRHSLPLPQASASLERNHAKTPYERRSPSVSASRSVSHQPPTPAAKPGTPTVITPTAGGSTSAESVGATPPVRQRKRTRTNETAEAGPSSSSGGSTTPSTSRTRSGQPPSNGSANSLNPSPTKKARLQAAKEAFQQATSPQLNPRANIGAGMSLIFLFSFVMFD